MTTATTATTDTGHLREVTIAVLLCVVGWFVFAVCDSTSKWLIQTYSVSQVICIGSLPAALVSAVLIFFKSGMAGFKTADLKWHMARAISVVFTSIFVVSALRTLPLADFYGITFLSPFVTALMAAFFLKEEIGRHRMLAIICGFAGVLVIAQPQFATYSIGLVFAFGATMAISGTAIVLRCMRSKENVLLFALFPAAANSIVHAIPTAQSFIMPSLFDCMAFGILAASILFGLLLIATGLRRAPTYAVVAPFQYTQIVWGIALGYLLFGDLPTATTLAGICVIVASGIYLIWREYQMHSKLVDNPLK